MRKGLLPLLLFAVTVLFAAPQRRANAGGGVSISFFFDELSPHGDWVTVGNYGHCWRPRGIDRGWQPYLNGEWLYTEDGWTWVSYDPWGGDPYHYGTWSRSDAYGWFWIPGTIWAPAWVTWYVGENDIGWAPVPPSFSVGSSGYLGSPVTVSRSSYVFVPATRFVGVNAGTVRVPATQNSILLARTRPMTRFTASGGVLTSGGPPLGQVERATGRKIARVSVGDAHTKAVPLDAGLRGRRSTVIAPATERARFIAPPHASAGPARQSASEPALKRNVPHEQTAPARERVEPAGSQREHARRAEPAAPIRSAAAAPARERHDAPAPRVEQASPPRKPDAAPQQGGKDHEPKKDHDREKNK